MSRILVSEYKYRSYDQFEWIVGNNAIDKVCANYSAFKRLSTQKYTDVDSETKEVEIPLEDIVENISGLLNGVVTSVVNLGFTYNPVEDEISHNIKLYNHTQAHIMLGVVSAEQHNNGPITEGELAVSNYCNYIPPGTSSDIIISGLQTNFTYPAWRLRLSLVGILNSSTSFQHELTLSSKESDGTIVYQLESIKNWTEDPIYNPKIWMFGSENEFINPNNTDYNTRYTLFSSNNLIYFISSSYSKDKYNSSNSIQIFSKIK
ncbi:hypothetical protein [Zooshikella sp. RANM57]|uniref:hypothetical protein n=1 Tax=Zooshikella sp. RANM57 TaxID=3425863 RepID=UPI003D6F3088